MRQSTPEKSGRSAVDHHNKCFRRSLTNDGGSREQWACNECAEAKVSEQAGTDWDFSSRLGPGGLDDLVLTQCLTARLS